MILCLYCIKYGYVSYSLRGKFTAFFGQTCFVYILLCIWRHSLNYAKFSNLSYIKNLIWHFLTHFLFLPVSWGCYFKKSWHARGIVRKLLLLSHFFMLLSPGSRFLSCEVISRQSQSSTCKVWPAFELIMGR